MRTLDIFYLVAVWFFVLALVSKEERIYSTILFLFAVFNIMVFDLFDFTSSFNHVDKKEFLIKLDGALGLIMTFIMYKEDKALAQAKILIFMVLCHTMVVLHLTNEESYILWFISAPFYSLYDKLIVILALLQMWVTRDGMANGLVNVFRKVKIRFLRVNA